VSYQDLSVEEALGLAQEKDQRVFVRFYASWCSSCKTLDEEVLSTRVGGELTSDMVAVSYDFDDEENRPLIERYVVLGLPTTLILSPDGTQVGRIMGYESKEQWVAEFREAKTAEDPVPALRAAHERNEADPIATLRLGQALLVRGHPVQGEALLERVGWLIDPQSPQQREAWAESLFILGRYHHRVRRDPKTAQHLWSELGRHFPGSEWSGGARWWYARSQAELGRADVGLVALSQAAKADPADEGLMEQVEEFKKDYMDQASQEPHVEQ
jgi:thiol-disulfide isomerase/thioredoxin